MATAVLAPCRGCNYTSCLRASTMEWGCPSIDTTKTNLRLFVTRILNNDRQLLSYLGLLLLDLSLDLRDTQVVSIQSHQFSNGHTVLALWHWHSEKWSCCPETWCHEDVYWGTGCLTGAQIGCNFSCNYVHWQWHTPSGLFMGTQWIHWCTGLLLWAWSCHCNEVILSHSDPCQNTATASVLWYLGYQSFQVWYASSAPSDSSIVSLKDCILALPSHLSFPQLQLTVTCYELEYLCSQLGPTWIAG